MGIVRVAGGETKPEGLMMFHNVELRKVWFLRTAGPCWTAGRVALEKKKKKNELSNYIGPLSLSHLVNKSFQSEKFCLAFKYICFLP